MLITVTNEELLEKWAKENETQYAQEYGSWNTGTLKALGIPRLFTTWNAPFANVRALYVIGPTGDTRKFLNPLQQIHDPTAITNGITNPAELKSGEFFGTRVASQDGVIYIVAVESAST